MISSMKSNYDKANTGVVQDRCRPFTDAYRVSTL
ncbi:unnamed protein product [Chondrus crispus]|uniref:Uncharacterized protein n=1 Tax=Chondrus crispus TaxID=2769 RepID=R7QND0_CHOCR|nr:unnamed protein product [Chondrus crispus]CDF39298.1 unnamed protein product [Chondrus crispus]|eukprot:XP_005719209.1 unnamed protein product [Chondrus crispus]